MKERRRKSAGWSREEGREKRGERERKGRDQIRERKDN